MAGHAHRVGGGCPFEGPLTWVANVVPEVLRDGADVTESGRLAIPSITNEREHRGTHALNVGVVDARPMADLVREHTTPRAWSARDRSTVSEDSRRV